MKFSRFEVRMEYVVTAMFQGWSITGLHSPTMKTIEPLLLALESSFIYLPVAEAEFVVAAQAEFARNRKPVPHEFRSAPIQYFVNSQLHYTAHRAISGRWPVEREVPYGLTSKHLADIRIVVTANDDSDFNHPPFNIWIETDPAREARVLHKNLEKLVIVAGGGASDIFVQFLYRTQDFDRLETIVQAFLRSIRRAKNSLGSWPSCIVAYATPSWLSQHETIDSNLVLFDGASTLGLRDM